MQPRNTLTAKLVTQALRTPHDWKKAPKCPSGDGGELKLVKTVPLTGIRYPDQEDFPTQTGTEFTFQCSGECQRTFVHVYTWA